jgi:SAM-dependent methyltransferase
VDKLRTKPWFEVWFDSPYYSLLYNNRDENEAQQFIDALLTFLKPEKQSNILDLACGKGRHAKYLASLGYDVTGIDLSLSSIREATKSEHERLHFYVHDMRNLFRINYFDFVFNFFTSFGYFEKDSDNIKALKAVGEGLKPDGKLVIDFMNASTVVKQLPFQAHVSRNGIDFNIEKKFENGFILKQIEVNDGGNIFHYSEKVQAITLQQFENYFSNAGLNIQQVFGSYQLEPYNENTSERLIIIGNKQHA